MMSQCTKNVNTMVIEVNEESLYQIYRINLLTLQTEYALFETESRQEGITIA